jgi:hypothetical protein
MNQVNFGNNHVSVAPMSVSYTHALKLYHTDNICISFDLSKIRYVAEQTEMDPTSNVSTCHAHRRAVVVETRRHGLWWDKHFVLDLLVTLQNE